MSPQPTARPPYVRTNVAGESGAPERADGEQRWENEGGRLQGRLRSARGTLSGSRLGAAEQLARESSVLQRDVVSRAHAVLEALAHNRWPQRELADLIDYLQCELVSQAIVVEQVPCSEESTAARDMFRTLTRDHVELRYRLESLTDQARHHDPADRGDRKLLAETVRSLVGDLSEHLDREQQTMAQVANRGDLERVMTAMHPHAWYALTHGPVIDLDAFPPDRTMDAVRDRLLRLHPGDGVELVTTSDPKLLCTLLLRDTDVAVACLREGPPVWRVNVSRRLPER